MLDNQTLLIILLGLAIYLYCQKKSKNVQKTDTTSNKKVKVKAEHFEESVDESSISENFSESLHDNNRSEHQVKEDFVLTINEEAIESSPTPVGDLKKYAKEIAESVNKTESESESSTKPSLNRNPVSRSGNNQANDGFPRYGLLPRGTDPDKIPLRPNEPIPLEAMLPKQDGTNEWVARGSLVELNETDILAANPRELFGIDTVAGSLRNASRDLRGTIPNPIIENLGPWNHTSIDPDRNLQSLTESRGGLFKDNKSLNIIKNSPILSGSL
jgi:hypothetical protein